MDNQIIQSISEMKGEMKYIGKTLAKVEKVLENQGVMLEKQNVANKRILDLETGQDKHQEKIVNLEKWQIKVVTIASLIATFVGFILNKVF